MSLSLQKSLVDDVASPLAVSGGPFCFVTHEKEEKTLFFVGSIELYDLLADIPRSLNSFTNCKSDVASSSSSGKCRSFDTISVIPFNQLKEKGYQTRDEGEKIICLKIENVQQIQTTSLIAQLPMEEIELEKEGRKTEVAKAAAAAVVERQQKEEDDTKDNHKNLKRRNEEEEEKEKDDGFSYDTTTDEYAKIVESVYINEICGGEGSSFVTPRVCCGKIKDFKMSKALSIYRHFLVNEEGAYWKFLFFDGKQFFIGATPEKHLAIDAQHELCMNPISGTFRKRLDHSIESMKEGGRVIGPLLKEMTHLIHSEYLLSGCSKGMDVIDAFRMSMFAPTVIGSPMGNACARLYEYEKRSRRYYSSAVMLLGRERIELNEKGSGEEEGKGEEVRETLDSCITIRTQEIQKDGSFKIHVGATLVKDSIPKEEVKETEWKAMGAIRSLQLKADSKNKPLNFYKDVLKVESQRKELQEKLNERSEVKKKVRIK